MLLDHLHRTKRRLRRKKPHGTPWGRAGSGDLSSLWLQQILGKNLQAWPSVALQLPGAGPHLPLGLFWSQPFSFLTPLWQESSRCPGSRQLLCSTLCPAHRLSELTEGLLDQSCRRQRADRSVLLLGWELDPRHEALHPRALGSLRCALLHHRALVFLLGRYGFFSFMLHFLYPAFLPHSSQYLSILPSDSN